MEYRIALIGVIVSNPGSVEKLNNILSEYAKYITGRMGIPHQRGGVSLISIAIDGPEEVINALSGRIGSLDGVSSKTIYPKIK